MLPLALSLLPAAFQVGQGFYQKSQAKKLKESTFVPPELLMNRDLANQQAYSRRAPGQAFAEEQIRRNTANTISAGQRSFGGDANKAAAVASAANAQANDATARLAGQGAQFSEQAFGRMANANQAIAGQKRQNRNEFNAAKSELLAASNQNLFNGISNAASAGLTAYLGGMGEGGHKGAMAAGSMPASGGRAAWSDYLNMKNGYVQDDQGVWRMPGFSSQRGGSTGWRAPGFTSPRPKY